MNQSVRIEDRLSDTPEAAIRKPFKYRSLVWRVNGINFDLKLPYAPPSPCSFQTLSRSQR
jgi:hypothetical protein